MCPCPRRRSGPRCLRPDRLPRLYRECRHRLQCGGPRALRRRLTELAVTESPFDRSPPRERAVGVHWVRPRLVGTVEYREYVGALRHPSWRGLRIEIDPVTVGLPG
ncbi:hypothetical protein [Nocardia sp. bgisy118]|uniref:ATP dependent DNA ligase n=1 Tax=Nocardia sp. bgisy118 TaxID=3413786 RepID=UPI003F4A8392